MNWADSVRTQLADEQQPFGVVVTVADVDNLARVRLYTASPLHETVLDLHPDCANVDERYDEAVRQHQRAVANLGGHERRAPAGTGT